MKNTHIVPEEADKKLSEQLAQELSDFNDAVGLGAASSVLSNAIIDTLPLEEARSTTLPRAMFRAVRKTLLPEREAAAVAREAADKQGSTAPAPEHRVACASVPEVVFVKRTEGLPVNEFTEGRLLIMDTNPTLFPFAEGLDFAGTVPTPYVRHLLLQFTGNFANIASLLFTLCNQAQRHAAIRAVSVQAVNKPDAIIKAASLAEDEVFREKVDRAIENPTGNDAKEVMITLQDLISTVGAKIPFSPTERASAITQLYALVQWYSLPSFFVTFSMDDAHSVLSLRLAYASRRPSENSLQGANNVFPARLDGFDDALASGAPMFEQRIPIKDSNLAALMNTSPVAAALYYDKLLKAFMEHIVGIMPDKHTRKTSAPQPTKKGMLGTSVAAFLVTEVQGRKALHGHILLWTLLGPDIIQAGAAFPAIVKALTEVLDTMIVSSLPAVVHAESMLRAMTPACSRSFQARATTAEPIIPSTLPLMKMFESRVYKVISNNGLHTHADTCAKGKSGKEGCRMGMPQPGFAKSQIVQLPNGLPARVFCNPDKECNDYYRLPFGGRANKQIVSMDLGRPATQPMHFTAPDGAVTCHPCPPITELGKAPRWTYPSEVPSPLQRSTVPSMITEVLVEPISYPDKVTPTSVFARNRYEEKVQASLTQDDQEEIASKSQAEWDAYANQLATYLNDRKTFSAYDRDMFCALLPLMNGGVVATSPVMANCLGTNTNVQTLGSTIQAKQILFYLIGYVTKDAVALQSSAAVIKHALTKAETWKSTAADAGSERRNGIYFLQIALNKLVGMSEIADTQAACVCLGIPSQFSTCRPTFVFAKAAMAAVKTRQNEDRGIHYRDEYVDEESQSSDSDAPCDGDNDEFYPREMQPYDLFASIAELGVEEGKGRSTHLQSGPEVQDVKGG